MQRWFSLSSRIGSLVLLALLLVAMAAPAAAGTCYGTYYEYYDSPAMNEIVGAKVSCPGYPDQHDTDVNGNYVETPWFLTETVVCPCPSGGGGGGTGGGEDTEDDG